MKTHGGGVFWVRGGGAGGNIRNGVVWGRVLRNHVSDGASVNAGCFYAWGRFYGLGRRESVVN